MNKSIFHDWVCELPPMMQSLLCTGTRGPDGLSKHAPAKVILRFFRGAILRPADPKYSGNTDSFMWTDYDESALEDKISYKLANITLSKWEEACQDFFNDPDIYPHHFIMHLIHAAEVIGYMHPKKDVADRWKNFYVLACDHLHMNPETKKQMIERLDHKNR